MRSSLMLLALILNACVGQRPDATTADGAEGSANVEEPDSTRDAADPGTKLEQCERLGALLETRARAWPAATSRRTARTR